MRFLPMGMSALLVELESLHETLALVASLKKDPILGVQAMVPAAQTVLIHFSRGHVSADTLISLIEMRDCSDPTPAASSLIEIPVHYQGQDLAEVASLLNMSIDALIACHTSYEYTVAFTGFAPGFAYLIAQDSVLHVPRRASPRTQIPAGSVALAGAFSGVYPQASPGGWQIIGVTPLRMWDINRDPPALLRPGTVVRFVDAGPVSLTVNTPIESSSTMPELSPDISDLLNVEVRSIGVQALCQDAGRWGYTDQGLGFSGAMDQSSRREANRLVGNPSNACVIESIGAGLQLMVNHPAVFAVTGADAPVWIINSSGEKISTGTHIPIPLNANDTLCLGQADRGLRSYVAVQGGFDVLPVLGSVATDILAHVGPRPLQVGDQIRVGPLSHPRVVGLPTMSPRPLPSATQTVMLDILLGPRSDWFIPDALKRLTEQAWQVTPQSNRIGLRLVGELPLTRSHHAELPSEGATRGAIQVPANGQPVIFGADHPLTGGYPMIAVIADHHLDLIGQLPVGVRLQFRVINP